jgi:predicted Zn-dependent protease
MGMTWLDPIAPDLGACIHRHGMVSIYAINYKSDENYSFEEILRHVTTHEIGRNLGLVWDCGTLGNCVMASWVGFPWPREKPYLCLNCIAAARESANRFLKADCY